MSITTTQSRAAGQRLHLLATPRTGVLGMPPGSIRALLTLMTVGFIVTQTARGIAVSLLWFESLIIVLAHYFAHRRLIPLSPALCEKLRAEDLLEDEPNPLYLPRYSLPAIIIAAFAGLGIYLVWKERIHDRAAAPVFFTLAAYFLGIGFGAIVAHWNKDKPHSGPGWFANAKALITLITVALEIVVQLTGWQHWIPYGDKLEAVPLALLLFYFGSR